MLKSSQLKNQKNYNLHRRRAYAFLLFFGGDMMTTYQMATTLLKWNPWWNQKTIFGWPEKRIATVYQKYLHEDADDAFKRYVNAANNCGTEDEYHEVLAIYSERFN
jgi:hypothetical protein